MKIALIYCIIGACSGAIIGASKQIVFITKNNKLVQVICDTLTTVAFWMIFSYLNHYFFYGDIRIHLALFFILGTVLERKTFGKLFAKLFLMLYNGLTKALKWFKLTSLGKFITK